MTVTTDPDVIRHLSEVSVSVEIETADMTLNIGPQHPSTHGVLRLVAKVDPDLAVGPGDSFNFAFDAANCHLFDTDSGVRLN